MAESNEKPDKEDEAIYRVVAIACIDVKAGDMDEAEEFAMEYLLETIYETGNPEDVLVTAVRKITEKEAAKNPKTLDMFTEQKMAEDEED